jgi:DNA-binding CsgD family transcriptional regulator
MHRTDKYHIKRPSNTVAAFATMVDKLTRLERRIFDLLIKRKSNKDIAEDLGIGLGVIETHRDRIMAKTHCETVHELAVKARECGLD